MDFALLMLLALGITGLIWGVDRAIGEPYRARKRDRLAAAGVSGDTLAQATKEPLAVEYARAFFPVILAVFLLRSFLVEPFRIPSGSMLPSLYVGDFILVNKFTYGIRIPVLNRKIIDINTPARGDVMVFRFPENPSDNYIKRVVGLPGDHIVYRDKRLFINGKEVPRSEMPVDGPRPEVSARAFPGVRYLENLDGVRHAILLSPYLQQEPMEFEVPRGQYFVMGDNRDHSNDSRYWGTVPEDHLVGKAFLIWFSWDVANGGGILWRRIGDRIR